MGRPILENIEAHLAYQVKLEEDGIIFAAGPIWTEDEQSWARESDVVAMAVDVPVQGAPDPLPDNSAAQIPDAETGSPSSPAQSPRGGFTFAVALLFAFFGGILLISGVGVRLAVIPMIMTMLVASFTVHGGAFDMQKGGMEYPLTLAVMLTSLGLSGPGRYTLAAAWKKTLRRQLLETKGELS